MEAIFFVFKFEPNTTWFKMPTIRKQTNLAHHLCIQRKNEWVCVRKPGWMFVVLLVVLLLACLFGRSHLVELVQIYVVCFYIHDFGFELEKLNSTHTHTHVIREKIERQILHNRASNNGYFYRFSVLLNGKMQFLTEFSVPTFEKFHELILTKFMFWECIFHFSCTELNEF